jgi:hypothetical protein
MVIRPISLSVCMLARGSTAYRVVCHSAVMVERGAGVLREQKEVEV